MTKSKTLQDRLDDLENLNREKSILVSRFLYERTSDRQGISLELVEQGFVSLDRKYLPPYVRFADIFFEDWGFYKLGTDTYRNCLEFLKKRFSVPQKTY